MTQASLKSLPQPADYLRHEADATIQLGLRPGVLLALLAVLVGVFLLALAAGSVRIPLDQIVTVLLGGEAERTSWTNIILKVRLPRALAAMLAGAALGVGGLMMQTYFRNPLADPFVLGVSSGASLGVALVVLSVGTVGGVLLAGLGLMGDLALAGAAAAGAALTMVLVLSIAARVRGSLALLLLGLMLGYLVSAAVSLLLYFSIPERIQAYVNWTFGSFSGVTWEQMPILAGGVASGLLAALALTKPLNALLLGENYAHTLGVPLRAVRLTIMLATALLAGTVTAFCGPISFIGMAVPHVCRGLLQSSDHRLLMPAVALSGAIMALAASVVAEVPGSSIVLPLNAVTALLGAPVVIWVLLRQRSAGRAFVV